MTITLAQIQAIISAMENFPLADIEDVLTRNNAATDEQIVIDVINLIAAAYPEAELAVPVFELIIYAIQNPDVNADVNNDPLGRGGRRA